MNSLVNNLIRRVVKLEQNETILTGRIEKLELEALIIDSYEGTNIFTVRDAAPLRGKESRLTLEDIVTGYKPSEGGMP